MAGSFPRETRTRTTQAGLGALTAPRMGSPWAQRQRCDPQMSQAPGPAWTCVYTRPTFRDPTGAPYLTARRPYEHTLSCLEKEFAIGARLGPQPAPRVQTRLSPRPVGQPLTRNSSNTRFSGEHGLRRLWVETAAVATGCPVT